MSRVVLVAGTGRSGTSAVAGILHKMGIHMGDEFTKSSRSNPYGTFEEKHFFDFNRSVGPTTDVNDWVLDYIEWRSEDHEIWGLKDPMLARVFHVFASYLDDVKVIVTRRNKIPSMNSYMYAYGAKLQDASNWYDTEHAFLEEAIAAYNGQVLYVDYDDLIENPQRQIRRIADYVYGESVDVDQSVYSHIRAGGRNFDRDGKWLGKVSGPVSGWGNVAVGVRIAKFPEYHFFTSWTKLLTGGVRNGDTVLMPVGWQPAHWAANTLARNFLRTDKDSLLMVDDDMVFEQGDLERLRSNSENWDFDIVVGFCTHRSWPPKAIVMREAEDMGLPYSLYGKTYNYAFDAVEDNKVIEVDAVGLAFTLIKRRVFEAMTEEYGPMFTSYFKYGVGFESDDIPFCQKARELGFKIGVDTSVKIGHIGQTVFGWNEYQQWSWEKHRPNVVEFDSADLIPILREAIPLLKENKVAAENALDWIGG